MNDDKAVQLLQDDAALAEYLTGILATNDAALLADTLGKLARGYGMRKIAQNTGMSREALYKALRPEAQPRFDTVNRVCSALGVKLVVIPAD